MTLRIASARYELYRCFDQLGVLLYVGIARDPRSRVKEHAKSSWWAKWVDRVVIDGGRSATKRADAEAIEQATIAAELPVFNKIGAAGMRQRMIGYLTSHGLDPCDYEEHLPPNLHWHDADHVYLGGRMSPRRTALTFRASAEELAVIDGWARTLGLTNYRGEPNRSATIQWLTTKPAADVIGDLAEHLADQLGIADQPDQNGDQS